MNRAEVIDTILKQFDCCAKEFCKQTQGFYCDIKSQYKGDEKPENIKYRFARIRYGAFTIRFAYIAHGPLNTINSILSCDVAFEADENAVLVPLPLVTDYCDMDIASPLCIPLITDGHGMVQAFSCIGEVLKSLHAKLDGIANNGVEKANVMRRYEDELKLCLNVENALSEDNEFARISTLAYATEYFALRFSSYIFINAIKGKREKAVKQLRKVKKKTGYETRLLALWTKDESDGCAEISAIVQNAKSYNSNGVQKTEFREFFALFSAWFVLCPLISALYAGVFLLLLWIESMESVYLLGATYYLPYCILMGFVTSIAVSYFVRKPIYKLFFRKNRDKYLKLDYIQNSSGSDRLMKGFLTVLIAGSLIACVLLTNHNVNFLENGFEDNTKFFSTKGVYHSYNEVEKIYYKPDRVNSLGTKLEYPSYVIRLKNGAEIDLYEYDDIERYEKELFPYLEDKGVKIEK